MEPIQVIERIREQFGDAVLATGEYRGQHSITVKKESVLDVCRALRAMGFDLLRDLTVVDYHGRKTPRFEVVYHVYSIDNRVLLRVKAPVTAESCSIDSVMSIWRGADWHEREAYDLFGVSFNGHPDLRRILMPEDWEGHPLRKDYPIKGPGPDKEWPGYKQVLENSKAFKEFEWNR